MDGYRGENEKRYKDLPLTVRAFLETLNEQKVIEILKAAELLGSVTPDTRAFLQQASPETLRFLQHARASEIERLEIAVQASPEALKWLQSARAEEIKTLDSGLRLVRALETVGWLGKWVIVTFVGAVVTMAMFGDAVLKMFGWFTSHGAPK